MLRFHTQTAGSTLTAQQPENNIVRTAIQAMAAVLGGTQSLHTNSFDEALALPTEQSARIALRTQQIIAYESGAPQTIDPLAGSYYIESLTNEIEKRAAEYLGKIEVMGGMLKAIERGYVQQEIQNAAYEYQQQVDHRGGDRGRSEPLRSGGRKADPDPAHRRSAGDEANRTPARSCALGAMQARGKRPRGSGRGGAIRGESHAADSGRCRGQCDCRRDF